MMLQINGKPLNTLPTYEIAFSLEEIEEELKRRREESREQLTHTPEITPEIQCFIAIAIIFGTAVLGFFLGTGLGKIVKMIF